MMTLKIFAMGGLAATLFVAATATTAEGGCRSRSRTWYWTAPSQNYYAAPAAEANRPTYRSFSYEPGAAPQQPQPNYFVPAPQRFNSAPPDVFRADHKARGVFR